MALRVLQLIVHLIHDVLNTAKLSKHHRAVAYLARLGRVESATVLHENVCLCVRVVDAIAVQSMKRREISKTNTRMQRPQHEEGPCEELEERHNTNGIPDRETS